MPTTSPSPAGSARRAARFAVLGAVAVLLAGCSGIQVGGETPVTKDAGDLQVENTSQSHDETIDRVEIDSDSGDVELTAGPDGSAHVDRTVRWTGPRPVVTETVDGTVLRITARCPDGNGAGHRCEVALTLTVPAAVAARTDLASGDITVGGLTGTQQHITASGDVRATGSGAAELTAATTSGDVDLSFAAPPRSVDARSTAGEVTVRVPAGTPYRVDATTTAGDVSVGVPVDPGAAGTITAHSTAGDVTVGHT